MTKVLGYDWEDIQRAQLKGSLSKRIDTNRSGDYGADPIGGGMFKMIPSGDIVGWEERENRLKGL